MNKTKKIALSAMLVALSVLYIWVMTTLNFKVDLGFWSFTPLSHVFLMPGPHIILGVFATIGTTLISMVTSSPCCARPAIFLRAAHSFAEKAVLTTSKTW